MKQFDAIKFQGSMDLDSALDSIPKGWHRSARNVEFTGIKGDMVPKNVPGTMSIFANLPAGNNVCIGRYFYEFKNQIYWANWNSNGSHGIYILNINGLTTQTLIQSGVNTVGDILNFNPNITVSSWDIIPGDENTGDLLFFIDSLGRPSMFNIQQYLGLLPLNPSYGSIQRDYIDLAKAPPFMAPKCTYENDYTVTVNQVRNSLFQFRTRFVYDNNNKSVYSQPSQVPLPAQSSTNLLTQPTSQNSRISVYFGTGDPDVKRIELWVQITTDSNKSDWLLIYSFEKSALAIPDNQVYRYLFYNNTVLTAGNPVEINQTYDYVPQAAGCGKIINGNVPMYGAITEGYPNPTISANITSALSSTIYDSVNGVLFFASQGGTDSAGPGGTLYITLTGAGNNDGAGNPLTVGAINCIFNIQAVDLSGNPIGFTFSNGSDGTITDILSGLGAAATGQGWTISSQTTNTLILTFNGFVLYSSYIQAPLSIVNNQAIFCYPYLLHNVYAPIYFDEKGRTPGASVFPNNSWNTGIDLQGLTVPLNTFTINNAPPPWAKWWALARGANSPKSLGWICNQTFTNVDLNTNQQYVYIGISNMPVYDKDIEASTPVVKYDFAPGDRIRFMMRYPITGSPVVLSTINDYAITSVDDDPIIGGIIQQGSFIKFPYPTSDIGPNFSFSGDNFQNYGIQVYSTIQEAAATNQIYFEYGKMFAIGGYGTANPYHIGNIQSQKGDLSQAAIVVDNGGDYFRKQRIVPAGNIYYINTLAAIFRTTSGAFTTVSTTANAPVVPIDNTQYQIANQAQNAVTSGAPFTGYPQFSNTDQLFWNKTGGPQTIRITGTGQIVSSISGTMKIYLFTVNSSGAIGSIYLNIDVSVVEVSATQTPYSFTINSYASIPANTKAWYIYSFITTPGNGTEGTVQIGGFLMQLQYVNAISIQTIENGFSDQYNIVTNSNGRSFAYDENAGTFKYGTRRRWGQAYQSGTSINDTNRFYPENVDEDPLEHGDIIRIWLSGKNAVIGQSRRIGIIGVYAKFIKNDSGQTELIVADDIITTNNIQYYDFPYGLGDQPDCIAQFGYQTYGVDNILGIIWRLSQDGLIAISQENRAQTWAGNVLPEYFNAPNDTYAPGGRVKILGAYHTKKHTNPNYIVAAQVGTGVTGDTLSFCEKNNAFESFFDYSPDMILGASNLLFSWKAGVLYLHNNNAPGGFTNFYGTNYNPSVSLIFNDRTEFVKTFDTVYYDSNQIWEAFNVGDIYTSLFDPQTGLQQISQLIAQDFEIREGRTYAAFLRDSNSGTNPILALLRGKFLKGVWIGVTLTYRGNNQAYIHNATVSWTPSPRNL